MASVADVASGLSPDVTARIAEEPVVVVPGADASLVDVVALSRSVDDLREKHDVEVRYVLLAQDKSDLASYIRTLRERAEFDGVLVLITPNAVGAGAAVTDKQILATLRAERGESKDATQMAVRSAERLASQQEGTQRSLLRIMIIGLICVLPMWLIWYIRATPRFGDDPDAVNVKARK